MDILHRLLALFEDQEQNIPDRNTKTNDQNTNFVDQPLSVRGIVICNQPVNGTTFYCETVVGERAHACLRVMLRSEQENMERISGISGSLAGR